MDRNKQQQRDQAPSRTMRYGIAIVRSIYPVGCEKSLPRSEFVEKVSGEIRRPFQPGDVSIHKGGPSRDLEWAY